MAEPAITRQAVHVSAGSNLPINRIVIHATCPDVGFPAASKHGAASGTAKYFGMASSGGSAHYVEGVDSEEHCVRDNAIAWHAPPNAHTIGVEITADGGDASAYGSHPEHAYTRAQWLDPLVWPAVVRAAARTAELCDRFNVPKVRLSAADLQAGKRGICGHIDVSRAFHQTDHSDPGPNFPWDEFMALIVGRADTAPSRGEPRPPLVQPAKPAPTTGLNVKTIDLRNANKALVKGAGVKPLQRLLGVTADGLGGSGTRTALGNAQKRCGLPVDYIFGPDTAEALLAGK